MRPQVFENVKLNIPELERLAQKYDVKIPLENFLRSEDPDEPLTTRLADD